ncbi:protein FAM13B isoform X2 [Tiliqua scincoides]|uniref:protein FAM13B isoform X2 n=1 Tax=Tiliqua scincoides TaxID=71010 RepID=UPI00346374DD
MIKECLKDSFDIGLHKDMRKSSSPSLSNCNSVLTNKIFGIPLDELQQEGQPGSEVPFIVRHVVDYIEEHGGLEQEGLFQVNGNAETVEWLRQRYDNGEDVDLVKEADVPSAISLLRYFLQALPEPVIPGILHMHLIQLSQDYNEEEFGRKLRFLLQQLPPLNYSLLKFLCRFLANVASHHGEIWSASSLAAVFGPDVFHIYTDVEDLKEQELVSRIMVGLLENYDDLFENEEEDFSSNDLSSITEQINDLLDEDDIKLEQSEELPEEEEENMEEREYRQEMEPQDMVESILESCSVAASTSAHLSPLSILPASADILERTIRAAVEQHLFDLQSSIDQDLKNLQHRMVCDKADIEEDEEGSNNQNETEKNVTKDDENFGDCCDTVDCTNVNNEVVRPDSVSEEEEKDQAEGILLKPCDEERGTEAFFENTQDCASFDGNKMTSHVISGFVSKVCNPDANAESEELKNRNNNAPEATLYVSVPHLDLKNVNDGEKWEAPCPITFPLIDFKAMHLQREGEEPFPAFKSWQEDSESGEAQLSPQAGRMNHPLEEDSHPILAHRSLDFGQSQRFLHDPEKIDSSSKALPFVRTRRASFSSSKDDRREDKTPYQLVKKLQKKIRQFEEQFEKDKNFKPSYSDLSANPKVLKWMTELTKLKKQIKDAKHKSSDSEFIPQTRPRSNTLPKSFGSSLDHDEENEDELRVVQKEKKPTKEDTVELIFKRLKEKRIERCLPEDIKKMTKDHLAEEKTSLQKSLLYYESQHGRPVSREERHIVKPLYDRYRLVKQMLTRASITPILGSPSTKRRSQMLQPIIEGETAHFFEEIKEEEEDGELSSELTDLLKPSAQMPSVTTSPVENSESDAEENQEKLTRELRLSSTRAASMPELLEQLWKARAEKKKLRKTLREFEDGFYQQNGRNVQKEDRAPMLDEYREYKKVKAKLRLLEVLISKQDSSKSI